MLSVGSVSVGRASCFLLHAAFSVENASEDEQ